MDVVRFVGGFLFLGLASLTVVPPSMQMFWMANVAVTEWGYWIACAALLPVIPRQQQGRLGKMGAVCSLGAIVLLVMPVIRASEMNKSLPAAFNAGFGTERRERNHEAEANRAVPLVLPELIHPLPLPPVRFEERVFRKDGDQRLTLDIYRPAYVHGPLPCVIVVHGGGWQGGDNSEFVALNAYLAGRDYIVAAINYRGGPFPAARDDVLSAVAYLKVFAQEIGIDPTRLALLGRSEGGQLALLAAYTANEPSVKGVISMYGPTDLRAEYDQPSTSRGFDTRRTLTSYLGGPPAKAEDVYFAASPINFVTNASPATLLIHGERDSVVSVDQSQRLDARLREAGVKHLFVPLPWATHGCDKSFGGPCGQIATYAIERFLDSVMVGQPQPEPKKLAANNARPGPRATSRRTR